MTNVTIPHPNDVLAAIAALRTRENGVERSIAEWRSLYRAKLADNRRRPDIAIFTGFVNCLLERAMVGEAAFRRAQAFEKLFPDYDAVTTANAKKALKSAGYRWGPENGAAVIMAAKDIVTARGFSWEKYIRRAEDHYETDFQDDDFRKIKNVSFKTRDLALSELSDRFVAIDLHVIRVSSRTGLLLHGYGDQRITTDVSKGPGYLFFHGLMLNLARRTGWPGAGYSPGEIDRMIWHFGRTMCNARPDCRRCPLQRTCLTWKRRQAHGTT